MPPSLGIRNFELGMAHVASRTQRQQKENQQKRWNLPLLLLYSVSMICDGGMYMMCNQISHGELRKGAKIRNLIYCARVSTPMYVFQQQQKRNRKLEK